MELTQKLALIRMAIKGNSDLTPLSNKEVVEKLLDIATEMEVVINDQKKELAKDNPRYIHGLEINLEIAKKAHAKLMGRSK